MVFHFENGYIYVSIMKENELKKIFKLIDRWYKEWNRQNDFLEVEGRIDSDEIEVLKKRIKKAVIE